MPGGVPVTLLFTDLEGSTQLVRELRGRYGAVLNGHRLLVRDAIAQYEGREIDTQGDSFFVAFAAPESAVLAAAEIHRALAGHEWPEGARVRVRIGIHTGRAEEHDGRYTGLAVHRAARVCAAAHGGQTLVTETVRSLLEDSEEELPGIRLRPVGEHQLKDFERPVGLYDVAPDGLDTTFPPPRTGVDSTPAAAPDPFWRRRRAALAVAALAAAALVVVAATRPWTSTPAAEVVRNSVVAIDPETNDVVSVIRLPLQPAEVTTAAGKLWMTSFDGVVVRVDPENGDVQTTGISGAQLAGDGRGNIWVVPASDRRSRTDPGPVVERPVVFRVDAERMRIVDRIRVPGIPSGIAVGGGLVWITGSDSPRYDRGPGAATAIEIETGERAFTPIPLVGTPFFTTFGLGALWVSNYDAGTVSVIRPGTARPRMLPFGRVQGPLGIAAGEGAVWVGDYWTDSVVRVDPTRLAVIDTTRVGEEILHVVAAYGAVWVTSRSPPMISRIDPQSNRVAVQKRLPYAPGGLAAGLGRIWITQGCEGGEPCP